MVFQRQTLRALTLMDVIAVEVQPVWVGHCSGITVLHKVDLKFVGLDVSSCSDRFSVDLGVFFDKVGPNLSLVDSQLMEMRLLA